MKAIEMIKKIGNGIKAVWIRTGEIDCPDTNLITDIPVDNCNAIAQNYGYMEAENSKKMIKGNIKQELREKLNEKDTIHTMESKDQIRQLREQADAQRTGITNKTEIREER